MNTRDRLLSGLSLEDERITVAGGSAAVLTAGAGQPVLLLHGTGEFAAVWLRVLPELARGNRVVAPDLPGHGASGPAGDALGWLAELIDRTCEQPPVVVGHGLGGALAASLASRQPHRFAELVLVDSLGLGDFAPAPSFAGALERFTREPTKRTRDEMFAQCFADLDRTRAGLGDRWTAIADYALEGARKPAQNAMMGAMMSRFGLARIPAEDLDQISVPTTLIWGRYDLQVLLRTAQTASARHGWPLHVIDEAGDDPAVEQPFAFLRALYAAVPMLGGTSRQESLR
jgi:pimeloyl-ACP methyl ester carboxylesterase